jgi:chromosome partitioning protein
MADLLLVPFVPRSFDIWTLEKVGALVGEMQPANPKAEGLCVLKPR